MSGAAVAARRLLVTGAPASGKSSVGRLVASGLERSVYIDADIVRESIVGGFVPPELPFSKAFIAQTELQREIVNVWAARMVAAGYTAVIDDAPIPPPPHFARQYAAALDDPSTVRVLLHPSIDALRERLTVRSGPFDEFFLARLDAVYAVIDDQDWSGWRRIDSSAQSVDETAREILAML